MTISDVLKKRGVRVTEYPDRESWLASRMQPPFRVNASEVAALYGESKYTTPYQMAQARLNPDKVMPAKDQDLADAGHRWEPFIIESAVARLREENPGKLVELVSLPKYCSVTVDWAPYLACTPDAIVVLDGELIPLEAKKVRSNLFREWTGEPPVPYQMQAMVQVICLDAERALIAGMIGDELQLHFVESDNDVIEDIMAEAEAFVNLLEARRLPAADGHDATTRAINFYSGTGGGTIEFDADFTDLVREREKLRDKLAALEEMEAEVSNKIKARLGSAEAARFPGGSLTWKPQGGKPTALIVNLRDADALKLSGIPYETKVSAITRPLKVKLV